jgi:hypothetical protein
MPRSMPILKSGSISAGHSTASSPTRSREPRSSLLPSPVSERSRSNARRMGCSWYVRPLLRRVAGISLTPTPALQPPSKFKVVWIFTTKAQTRIISIADVLNARSIAVMKRLAMTLDHTAELVHEGDTFSAVIYAITKERWQSNLESNARGRMMANVRLSARADICRDARYFRLRPEADVRRSSVLGRRP